MRPPHGQRPPGAQRSQMSLRHSGQPINLRRLPAWQATLSHSTKLKLFWGLHREQKCYAGSSCMCSEQRASTQAVHNVYPGSGCEGHQRRSSGHLEQAGLMGRGVSEDAKPMYASATVTTPMTAQGGQTA